jgi:uncharacterized protein YbjT (DUF2867 family)
MTAVVRGRRSVMITILGATGNVGRKIADILTSKGEKVRLVARTSSRLRPLVGRHAQAFAGDAMNTGFLIQAFKDADAVFTLIPPNLKAGNYLAYADTIGDSIVRALKAARVRHVVNLSSIGADLPGGTGPIAGLHNQEERLDRIEGLNVVHLRPAFFMENLLTNIDLIRSKGINGSAIRGDLKFPMIATRDVASAAAERLIEKDFTGSSIEVLLGERHISMVDATEIIGRKIGKPGLAYVMFPYDEAEKGLIAAGLSPDMSRLSIEMSRAINEGRVFGNIVRTPVNTTPTSFETFCDEVFVPLFMQKRAA